MRIQLVLDAEVVPSLMKLIPTAPLQLLMPSVRIIGNICAGSNEQCDVIGLQNLLFNATHRWC